MSGTAAPPTTDRRVAPRHQPTYRTVCHLIRDEPHVGLVWNISQSGISMLLGAPPATGVTLDGILSPEGEVDGLPVNLRVVHVREVSTGDYLVGARFDRTLEPEEIEPFLAGPMPDRELPRKG